MSFKTIKELEAEININNWKRHDRDIKIAQLKGVLGLIDEFKPILEETTIGWMSGGCDEETCRDLFTRRWEELKARITGD